MTDLEESGVDLDVALLEGLGFACRPDCGLCCFAEPRVLPSERSTLVQIAPDTEFVVRGPDQFLASRPDGGACQFLSDNRCGVHVARPHPCREFPLTAHVGERLQVTVVLSCPGVDLSVLGGEEVRKGAGGRAGFPTELAALRERILPTTQRRLDGARRRRRKVMRALEQEGRWESEGDVRRALGGAVPMPTSEDFPVDDPPSATDGLELLPLFFDQRAAPVALAAGLGGWELLELRANGGVARSLGVVPPPERMPALTAPAAALLRGYLDYWLRRDALFGTVHVQMLRSSDDAPVTEWVADELRAIGALVLSRAEVRAKLRRGAVDRLTAVELVDGIRATDQDLLDRASWGDRF